MREILSDLVAEEQALDQFLQRVHEREWTLPTPARGWSIMDTVCHLAYSEVFAADVIKRGQNAIDEAQLTGMEDWMERGIIGGRGKRYQAVIEWWRNGRASVVDALSRTSATEEIPWLIRPLGAKAFATTRLMETWSHGLDIKDAMEGRITIGEEEEDPRDDSPRLRHVAWLAHRALPYAFEQSGAEFPEGGIRVELMAPKYARWVYGPADAENVIKGVAGEWCRVAVDRLDPAESGLKAEGDAAETATRVVRMY